MLLKVVETDMKKRIAVYAALCIVFILFSSCHRNAKIEYIEDPSWSKIQVKATLVIGVSDFVPILSFINEKNEIVGYDVDILKELCRRLGIHPVFYPIDWTQKEMLLNTGIIDCIASGFSLTEERKQHYRMCKPYLQNAKIVGGREFDYMTMYILVALIYWSICLVFEQGQKILEKRLSLY